MNNNNLYINTMQIILKAHKYCYGETLLYDIRYNKVKLVIIASDIGAASGKKIVDKCTFYKIPYQICLDKETLRSVFKKDLSSFGILDDNLAKKFLDNLNKGGVLHGN